MDALRRDKPLIGPTFAFFFLYIHNYISYEYSDFYPHTVTQKSNTEENANELEMACFIEERLMDIFHEGSNRTEIKLFCDETIFTNKCLSEAEPFCLNSECIVQCTEERILKLEKKTSCSWSTNTVHEG